MEDEILIIKYKRLVEEVVEVPIYEDDIIDNLDKFKDSEMLDIVSSLAFDETISERKLISSQYLDKEVMTQDKFIKIDSKNQDKESKFWEEMLNELKEKNKVK